MSRPIIKEVNLVEGLEIEREMNDIEFTQYKAAQIIVTAEIEAKAAKETAKIALLDRLGITADEAALLLS